ncbi:TPA: hypothetical protein ACRL2O_006428, partial [Pseudomonas aeruginosa]
YIFLWIYFWMEYSDTPKNNVKTLTKLRTASAICHPNTFHRFAMSCSKPGPRADNDSVATDGIRHMPVKS